MSTNPLDVQVGGGHYKDCAIQPVQYIHANKLGFCEGSVVKYVTRWRDKGGRADLEKAIHFLQLLIEMEFPRVVDVAPAPAKQMELPFNSKDDLDAWVRKQAAEKLPPHHKTPGSEFK